MDKKIVLVAMAFFALFAGTAFAQTIDLNGNNYTNNYTTSLYQIGDWSFFKGIFNSYSIGVSWHKFTIFDTIINHKTANFAGVSVYKATLDSPLWNGFEAWGLDIGKGLSSKLGDYAILGNATRSGLTTGDFNASGTVYANKIVASGITIKDSITGLPVCIKSLNGTIKSIKGAC